jgi:hypothetical protein
MYIVSSPALMLFAFDINPAESYHFFIGNIYASNYRTTCDAASMGR